MPTVLQQLWSPMERAFAAREAAPIDTAQDDDIGLGCESAYPFLQFDAWEPLDAQRTSGAVPNC